MALTCGSPTGPTVSQLTPVSALRVGNNVISGWVLDTVLLDTIANFNNTTAGQFADGGDADYCGVCNGTDPLQGGLGTYFKNSQGRKLEVFVLNYGTAPAAKTEFNFWVNQKTGAGSTPEAILPFSDTAVVAYYPGGGLHAYAHFDNYYIELQFNDYDSSSEAVPDANTFLTYYSSRIK